ncbi:hypothetical protein [Rhodoplanes roseus]|uniref:hypothetical protein n=1 Tax=Rhodoplanes roseus TaxID=29409 RepID=UPI0014752740|nr:hypothetical protein [Rhodoplanes roseus]
MAAANAAAATRRRNIIAPAMLNPDFVTPETVAPTRRQGDTTIKTSRVAGNPSGEKDA